MIRSQRGRRRSKKNTLARKHRNSVGRKLLSEVLEDRQLLASDVASSICAAGTCTETESFSGVPDLNDAAVFDQFDTSLGTLLSVKVSLELTSDGGSFQADNDSDQPASFDVSFGADGTLSSADVGLFSAIVPIPTPVFGTVSTSQGATFNLTGNDGDDTTVFNQGGTDWDQFDGTAETSMDMGNIDSTLFPGYEGTSTFNIDYDITQVADTTSAGGVFRQIDPVTASGEITVTYTYEPIFNPAIDLEKFLYEVNDSTDLSGDIFPGDSLLYVFEVQNTGDIALDNVSLSDSLAGVTIGAEVFTSLANVDADSGVVFDGDLDPNETVFFVGSYTVTEADATAGEIVNNATVTGDDPSGSPTDDGGTDVTIVQPTPLNPAIELDKFVWDVNGEISDGSPVEFGDEIVYAFEVTNTGDTVLTDVGVTDALPGVVIGTDVYATTSPYSQPNFIPADGDLGPFASVDSTLASDPFEAQAWDNFTLTGDTVLDGIDWAGAYIEPFATGLTPETDFVIQIFSDASGSPGSLVQSFSLDGGEAGVSDADVVSTLLGHTAEDGGPVYGYSADLPKTHLGAGDYWISIRAEQTFPNPFPKIDPTWQWHLGSGPGDGFYTYDDIFDDAGDNGNGLVDGTPTAAVFEDGKDLAFTFSGKHQVSFDGSLDPGETAVFVGTYTVTAADAVAGEVVNDATATGDDPNGDPVDDGDSETVPVVPFNPSVDIDKFVWDINGVPSDGVDPVDVGDEIIYAFAVTNDGDVELTNVTVTDALPGVVIGSEVFTTSSSPYSQPNFIPADGVLGPYASVDGTLVSDSMEAKAWDNFTLTGTTILDGIDWAGAYVEPFATGLTPETDFIIEIFSDASGSPGSLVYSFSLDGGLAGVSDGDVTSSLLGHTAENGGPVYQYSADLPKTELHAGDYWISITADQTFPNPFPKIDPTWQWHLGSGPGDGFYTYDDIFDDPGDNGVGLVDGTPAPAVFDPAKDLAFTLSGKYAFGFDGSLDPGETVVFSGTYTVTEDDAFAGEVVNKGTVNADDPAGGGVMDMDTETVPVVPKVSSIEIDKYIWDLNGLPDIHPNIVPGDELLYAFNVTNTGDTKLSNVTVTDSLPGFMLDADVSVPFTAFEQPLLVPADGNLGPFASKDALAVTDDLEAKAWDNFSLPKPTVIEGISWAGAYVEPFAAGGLTPDTDFFIEIYTDLDGAPGHLIEYFPLDGGMAGVSDANVKSTLLGHTAEDGGPVYSYDAMLPFTQLQAGDYWVSITAIQSFPNPAPTIDPTWQWHLGSGAGDGFYTYDDVFDDTGDGRPFPAQLATGKDLAFELHAAELNPEFDNCLHPGETVMYMGTYIVTEADVLAGEVVNKGTVTADDPRGTEVMDMDTETVPIAQQDPEIDINKYLWDINGSPTLTSDIHVGDELIYSLDVTNTGGTKLTNVEVTDSLPGAEFDEQVVVPFIAHEQSFDIPSDGKLGPFSSVDRTLGSDPQEAKAWDNFSFAEDTVIDGVSWVGAYVEPFAGGGAETPETDFLIEVFSDDAGPDAAVLTFTVNGGDAGVNDAQLVTTQLFHTAEDGGPVYSYKAMIPFTYVVAGDYWISITALQTFPNASPTVDPTWQWHLADQDGADGFYTYDDIFDDVGDGTPFAANFEAGKDLTFTLHGAKQIDFNGMLNPGEMVMFMVTYHVTEEDVLAGEVINKGTVTAHDPSGGTVMDMDTETVEIDPQPISPPTPANNPSVFIDKYLWDINGSPDLHNDIKVGDELIYGIDIVNDGDVKLSNIEVSDQVWLVEVDEEVAIPYIAVEQGPFVPISGEVGAYSTVNRDLASDPLEAKAWDNFTTNRTDDWTVVDAITWYGAYDEPFASGSSPQTDFLVEFAEADSNGKPGTVLHSFTANGGVAGVDDANVDTTLLSHTTPDGGPVYKYHAMLPFSGFVNGDYFVSITALQTFPSAAPTVDPSWQWHLGSGSGDGFYTYDDAFDDANDGTPFAANLEAGKDLAFTLHAAELIEDFDGMLDPGERVMYMARYIVRQVDIDKGVFQNDAVVEATAPDGTELRELDWDHVDINQNPSLTLAAAPAAATSGQVGASTSGTTQMFYTVTNDGDVSLYDVSVFDSGVRDNAVFIGPDAGEDGVMSPGEVWLFEGLGANGMETMVTGETLTGLNTSAELMHEFCIPNNGDIDGDGQVAFSDFLVLSRNFGATDADLSMGDIDCDGQVAFSDFLVLSRNFGQSTIAGEAGTAAAAAAAADAAFDADDDEEDWLF